MWGTWSLNVKNHAYDVSVITQLLISFSVVLCRARSHLECMAGNKTTNTFVHGVYIKICSAADAMSEGSPCLMISSSWYSTRLWFAYTYVAHNYSPSPNRQMETWLTLRGNSWGNSWGNHEVIRGNSCGNLLQNSQCSSNIVGAPSINFRKQQTID